MIRDRTSAHDFASRQFGPPRHRPSAGRPVRRTCMHLAPLDTLHPIPRALNHSSAGTFMIIRARRSEHVVTRSTARSDPRLRLMGIHRPRSACWRIWPCGCSLGIMRLRRKSSRRNPLPCIFELLSMSICTRVIPEVLADELLRLGRRHACPMAAERGFAVRMHIYDLRSASQLVLSSRGRPNTFSAVRIVNVLPRRKASITHRPARCASTRSRSVRAAEISTNPRRYEGRRIPVRAVRIGMF